MFDSCAILYLPMVYLPMIEQVLTTLLCHLHFALPSAVDADGVRKEIYWRMDVLQVPVVRPPHGDLKTTQAPLDIRLVRESDFS